MKRLKFNLRYIFGTPRWDTGIVPPEVIEYVAQHPPGRALDIGSGTGTNMLYLARHGWQVDGFDFALSAVCKARRRLRKAGFPPSVWVDDITRLTKIEGAYNFILDIGCFHQLSPEGRQAEMLAVDDLLMPGGSWMIYGHCQNPGDASTHGLAQQDISALADRFELIRREDGQEGARGPSVWLWLERKDS